MKKAVLLVLLAMVTFGAFALNSTSLDVSRYWFMKDYFKNDIFDVQIENKSQEEYYFFENEDGEFVEMKAVFINYTVEELLEKKDYFTLEISRKDLTKREEHVAHVLTEEYPKKIVYCDGWYGKCAYMRNKSEDLIILFEGEN